MGASLTANFNTILTFGMVLIFGFATGTTVFHEFIGPLFSEIGLKKANEVKKEDS